MGEGRLIQIYRSCLFQIIIVGLVAFCEPGIWTALNNLGAGGNASVSKVLTLLYCKEFQMEIRLEETF